MHGEGDNACVANKEATGTRATTFTSNGQHLARREFRVDLSESIAASEELGFCQLHVENVLVAQNAGQDTDTGGRLEAKTEATDTVFDQAVFSLALVEHKRVNIDQIFVAETHEATKSSLFQFLSESRALEVHFKVKEDAGRVRVLATIFPKT